MILEDSNSNLAKRAFYTIQSKAFKTQLDELKSSILTWKNDEFPKLFTERQNTIIANIETLMVNKVISELGNLMQILI
jgi:hypothetical protein